MNIAADTTVPLAEGMGKQHHGILVSRILAGTETHALTQVLQSLVQPTYSGRKGQAANCLVLIHMQEGTCIQEYKHIMRTQVT